MIIIAGLGLLLIFSAMPAVAQELVQPSVRMELGGETGARTEAVLRNWIMTAPNANPGMLEMMRLRDRTPPYENPVPWAGEFAGKYLTSAVMLSRMVNNPAFDAHIETFVKELISTQAEDGYMGPFPDKHLLERWDLWGHYHCMMGLYLWHQETGDQKAMDAVLKAADLICDTFLDSDKRVHDTGSLEMNMAVIHMLGILHRETGSARYFQLMREIEKDWEKPPAGDYLRQALTGMEYYQTPKPRWESLHPMLGLGELYRITGEEQYKKALLHWWYSINKTDVHNAGSFSTHEQAVGNPFQPGAIETCCTVAWMAYSVEALQLSGDSAIADALERATWNAVLSYQHPSGRWCTYDTPMDGKRQASAHSIVFQSRPGTPELNCCSVNGPRGLGLLSEWALLGGSKGVTLNYYGPGVMEATLKNGSIWRFIQETNYPQEGAVTIRVQPDKPTFLPLYLRIPSWSSVTHVSVNGESIANVKAGTFLKLTRKWRQDNTIQVEFDMTPWCIRGDHHVAFGTSLFRGPLLLCYDQKFNAVELNAIPELDFNALDLKPVSTDARFQPIVLFSAKSVDEQEVMLCDYATAGAHGTAYRSWLPVRNAPPAPFYLQHPENDTRLPMETMDFLWSEAEPGSAYGIRISEDASFSQVVFEEENLSQTGYEYSGVLREAHKYYWEIIAVRGNQRGHSKNGPFCFQMSSDIPSSFMGTVVKATLAGDATPEEGGLLLATDLIAAKNQHGKADTAISFNGESSKLVYDAPQFPSRTFTFSAWVQPYDLEVDGNRWHHIFSAWAKGSDDPLRVSVRDKLLVINIERSSGGSHINGGPLKNLEWTHVAVVKRDTALTLYINGKAKETITVPSRHWTEAKNLGIGCNPNYSDLEGFRGRIAEVLFSREAYSEDAIAQLAGVQ